MELFLIRHGATAGNAEHRFIGVTDELLSPLGEEQARKAVLPPTEHVYTSPLLRCRQTAQLIWPDAAFTVLPDLRENDFGPFEGMCHRELEGQELYEQWLSGRPVEGVETTVACRQRASRALRAISRDARERGLSSAAVVTHGGTILQLLSLFGEPRREFYSWSVPNCSGWRCTLERSPLALRVTAALNQV